MREIRTVSPRWLVNVVSVMPKVIVPPYSGVFSAWGMLMADLRHDFALTQVQLVNQADVKSINKTFKDLASRVRELFKIEKIRDEDVVISHEMDLRYLGQEHTLSVPVPAKITEAAKDAANKKFDELHYMAYGQNAPNEPKEVVSLKVSGLGRV